jgi:hypothetical protein
MSDDLPQRLRRWTHAADAIPASDLMDEAADEIDRLRMRDDERNAIKRLVPAAETYSPQWAAPLQRFLDRTGETHG